MNSSSKDKDIVVFAKSPLKREYLRNIMKDKSQKVICFENVMSCFDNLSAIKPDGIVLVTDSASLVWKFIFAIQYMQLPCLVILISDILDAAEFELVENENVVGIRTNQLDSQLYLCARDINVRVESGSENTDQPVIVGQSKEIRKIKSLLPSLANSNDPILIQGEHGTGKELLSRSIVTHINQNTVFVKYDCRQIRSLADVDGMMNKSLVLSSAVDQSLSHCGASNLLVNYFQNINLLPQSVQAELLLYLDDFELKKLVVSGVGPFKTKIIATSDENLDELHEKGKFRKDLYYRLNVFPIYLPALRARKEDILMLVDFFMIKTCAKVHKSFFALSTDATEKLYYYNWPRNVDELESLAERIALTGNESVIFGNDSFTGYNKNSNGSYIKLFADSSLKDLANIKRSLHSINRQPLKKICDKYVSQIEKKIMQKALECTNWNRKKAAALLNISYKSMLNKMKLYEIA
ncbi:MAG: sigma-54-dependent Fis family transcriptional regulator [Desulfobacteraceae bacterium]|nr:sigma-54-dependent Fis family transcriptional regulator [Desulfobacteraceae bacterium]